MSVNQKCRGGVPAFIRREIRSKDSDVSKNRAWEENKLEATLTIIRVEAIACTKKYLIAASVRGLVNLISIRGIMLIKLISNPSQQVNQEFALTAASEPKIKVRKNKYW